MFSGLFGCGPASGSDGFSQGNFGKTIRRWRRYEKYKHRLMETGADALYELADLDPNDPYIAELCDFEERQIAHEEIITFNDPYYSNYPPRNSHLTNEKAIWAGNMCLTGQSLPLPPSRSASGTAVTGLPGCGFYVVYFAAASRDPGSRVGK